MNASPQQITETVSENTPKRKRGRPITARGIHAKEKSIYADSETTRSHLNFSFRCSFHGIISKLSDERANEVFGFTKDDIMARRHLEKRKGMETASVQIVRWIETHGTKEDALDIIADARGKGYTWTIIGKHFRNLRLGEREGNAMSFTSHLCRAFDDYIARFPATTTQAQVSAIRNLLDLVEAEDE